ncbi:MAG: helix-turn-helix domain-containing protein [Planctomycetota bacterium]
MTSRPHEPDLGRRLASARLQRSLSQGTAARLAGIAPSYLSRIETGKVHPTFRTVLRIATALRLPLDQVAGPGPLDKLKDGPCPISAGGHCLLDLIRCDAAADGSEQPEVYTPRQVRLLRRFATWLRRIQPDRLKAMEVLLEELLGGASRP